MYRGVVTRLNRPVAIKLLSAALSDLSVRRRFQQEAKMASALNHPHILTLPKLTNDPHRDLGLALRLTSFAQRLL